MDTYSIVLIFSVVANVVFIFVGFYIYGVLESSKEGLSLKLKLIEDLRSEKAAQAEKIQELFNTEAKYNVLKADYDDYIKKTHAEIDKLKGVINNFEEKIYKEDFFKLAKKVKDEFYTSEQTKTILKNFLYRVSGSFFQN